jgi:hypothetical protein
MKMFISATQYNEIYSEKTGILISKKICDDVNYLAQKLKILQDENANLIKKISYALSIMKDNHLDAEESEIEYQVYKILENALNEKL